MSIALLLFSCNAEKRIYRPGFYFAFNGSNGNFVEKQRTSEKKEEVVLNIKNNFLPTLDTINNLQLTCLSINENNNKPDLIVTNKLPIQAINHTNKKEKKLKNAIVKYNKSGDSADRTLFILFLILAILTIPILLVSILFGVLAWHFYKKYKGEGQSKKKKKDRPGFAIASISLAIVAVLSTIAVFVAGNDIVFITGIILGILSFLLSIIFGGIALFNNNKWWWKAISILGIIISFLSLGLLMYGLSGG